MQNCNDNEKKYLFRDLLCKNIFNSDSKLCIISKGEGYRFIDNEKEWKELLILFANTTMREEDFAKKIILLYDSLVFDEEISKSMKKINSGTEYKETRDFVSFILHRKDISTNI